MALTEQPDRDKALERVLRRLAVTGDLAAPAVPSEDCFDAERIAAMVDGGLLPHELEEVAGHAATCPRCREILAEVVRTTPEPEPRAPWWRLPALRWMAPLVATGFAVAVWVAVGNQHPNLTTTSTPAPATAVASPPAAAPPPLPSAEPAAPQLDDSFAKDSAAAPPVPAPTDLLKEHAAVPPRRDELARVQPDRAPVDAPTEAAPAPASTRTEAQNQVAAAAKAAEPAVARPLASPPPPASPAAPPAPVAPLGRLAKPAPPSDAAAAAPAQNAARGAAPAEDAERRAAALQAAAPAAGTAPTLSERSRRIVEIRTPDPQVLWRLQSTTLERSTDGGATWAFQATGTLTHLNVGSAPRPNVCWIVGEKGTIIVTDDGVAWQKIQPPDVTSFVSVRAASANAVTIKTRDGRTFSTTDRGRTWTLAPAPQELPATPF